MMLLPVLRLLSTPSLSGRSSGICIECRCRSLQMVSVVRTCETIVISRSGRRGICFLDDLIFGIWPARRLSFGTQLLQRLLRFCRQRALRQDFRLFLIVSSRLFRLLQFFEALGRTEIYKRVIRLIYKCLLISISRRAIVLSLKVKISDLHILRELPVGLRRIRRFISRRRGPAGVHDSVNAPGNQFGEFAFYSRLGWRRCQRRQIWKRRVRKRRQWRWLGRNQQGRRKLRA